MVGAAPRSGPGRRGRLDEGVTRVLVTGAGGQLGRAVDALQVAAVLEADGHTDRAAQVEYGYSDLFALASEVFRRLGPPSPVDDEERPQLFHLIS